MNDMNDELDEVTKQRLMMAQVMLKSDQLLKMLEENSERTAAIHLSTVRDMSICWAFVASAAGTLEGAKEMMPPEIREVTQIEALIESANIIRDILQRGIDRFGGEEEVKES